VPFREESCRSSCIYSGPLHSYSLDAVSQHPSTRAGAESIQLIYSGRALQALSDLARQFRCHPIFWREFSCVVCVYICVCVYVCGHVYMYIYACVYVLVHLCVYTHVYVYVYAYLYIDCGSQYQCCSVWTVSCMCICVRVHMYAYA